MPGQEPSNADPNGRDLLLLAVGKDLSTVKSHWSWSNFIDPTKTRLYQTLLDRYQIPAIIADNTVIHTLPNTAGFNDVTRRRALSTIIRFKAGVLKISRPNVPDPMTLLRLVMV